MVQYEDADAAKEALNSVRGTYVANSKRLMVRLEVIQCTCVHTIGGPSQAWNGITMQCIGFYNVCLHVHGQVLEVMCTCDTDDNCTYVY